MITRARNKVASFVDGWADTLVVLFKIKLHSCGSLYLWGGSWTEHFFHTEKLFRSWFFPNAFNDWGLKNSSDFCRTSVTFLWKWKIARLFCCLINSSVFWKVNVTRDSVNWGERKQELDKFFEWAGLWFRAPSEREKKRVSLWRVEICYLEEDGRGKRARAVLPLNTQ